MWELYTFTEEMGGNGAMRLGHLGKARMICRT